MVIAKNIVKTFKLSRQQKREMGDGFQGNTIDAVCDISFTCQPGRVFALLGPNGAGKTTALRMIATMLKPTSGSISVAEYDTVAQSQAVRENLGFLTGNTGLYDRLTPNEMVRYFADLHGMNSADYNTRRDHLFALLDMEAFANRRIGKLSTGIETKSLHCTHDHTRPRCHCIRRTHRRSRCRHLAQYRTSHPRLSKRGKNRHFFHAPHG